MRGDFNQIFAPFYTLSSALLPQVSVKLWPSCWVWSGRRVTHQRQGSDYPLPLPIARLGQCPGPDVPSRFDRMLDPGSQAPGGNGIFLVWRHPVLERESCWEVSLISVENSKKDWLDPRTPLLKLQSTRIGTVVEKGFKFLLLEIVKENIQFINSYSLRLILF